MVDCAEGYIQHTDKGRRWEVVGSETHLESMILLQHMSWPPSSVCVSDGEGIAVVLSLVANLCDGMVYDLLCPHTLIHSTRNVPR